MSVLAKTQGSQDGALLRFDPAYWQIDFNIEAAASLITTGDRSLKLTCTFRTDKDLVGLIWHSVDEESHVYYRYATDYDYRGCVWQFDFKLTNLVDLDANQGLVLTAIANDEAETPYYVRLENYRIAGSTTHGRVRLDFSTVEGGFNLPAEAVTIPWGNIRRFFLGVTPAAYVATETSEDQLPITEVEATLELYNMSCTGTRTHLGLCTVSQSEHALRMTDGLDDAYHLTPQRIVAGVSQLGYRDWYTIYLGITHMHQVSWSEAESRFVVDPSKDILNLPTRTWLKDLWYRLAANGYRIVVSVSYEILKSVCPADWAQRTYDGSMAQTGWDPPSSLIAPTNADALDYLTRIFDWSMTTIGNFGAPLYFQVGEPWWWDGTYTDGAPCIYDDGTQALYVAETGYAVPTPLIQSYTEEIGVHGTYLAWLRDKLGDSTLTLRDNVLAAYPSATSLILIYTPQILNPASKILSILNFPVKRWSWPAWDILQLEDYDWVIDADWTLHSSTLDAGTAKLNYPLDQIQFFGGFNLLAETADTVWPNIDQSLNDGFAWGASEVAVWARPQVWRDGFLWEGSARATCCACETFEVGPIKTSLHLSYTPVTGGTDTPPSDFEDSDLPAPIDLAMVGNSFGDVRLSWDPNGNDESVSWTIDLYDAAEGTLLSSLADVSTVTLEDGRLQFDLAMEVSSPIFGFAPTYLVWRARPNGYTSSSTALSGAITINNAAIVKKVFLFLGQSNMLGHETTLSGATVGEGSAAAFRRNVADRLGLSHVEVIPVMAAWGSSASDRLADDDPVDGVNYWWDLEADAAGPRLTQTIEIISGLGVSVSGALWGEGENVASAYYNAASGDSEGSGRTSSPERYKACIDKIHAAIRTACGNAGLPIWFQTLGRGWWGDLPDPPEAGGAYYKAIRDMQVEIVTEQEATYVGSWVPGCETIDGYVQETGNPGWVHYTAAVYLATALELAEAVATPLDRLAAQPAWTLMTAPVLTPNVDGYDVTITWPAGTGESFIVVNLNVVDGTTISTTAVSESSGTGTWTFTGTEQIAEYGYAGGWVNVQVYQVLGSIKGPAAQATFDPSTLDGYAEAPTGLAVAHATGWDLDYSWDAEDGASYVVVNRNVTDNSVLSTNTVVASGTTASWTFTGAAQIAAYTTPASYAYFEVCRVYGAVNGPTASLTQEIALLSGGVVAPTGLAVARGTGWEDILSWTTVIGRTYRFTNYDVTDNSVLHTEDIVATATTTSYSFSGADQITAYEAPASYVYFEVAEVWDDYAGPVGSLTQDMSLISGGPSAPTGLAASWPTQDSWDIALKWTAVVGRTYRVTNRKVTDSSTLSTTDVTPATTTGSLMFSASAQISAYSGAHARYVDFDVAEVWDGYAGPVATLVHDMWTPALLDSTAPVLWSDAVSGRSIVSSSETTHATLFPRTGAAKVVVGSDGAPATVAANTVAYSYASGARRDLREGTATNLLFPSAAPTAAFTLTTAAQDYTLSFWGTGSIALSGAYTATATGTGANVRTTLTFTSTAASLTLTFSGTVTNVQLETGSVASSYIATTTATVTRTTDVCQWSSTAAALISGNVSVAYRGEIASKLAAQNIVTSSIQPLFLSQSGDPSRLTWNPPGGAAMGSITSYLPGEIGVCLAWGSAGAAWSVNGATPGTNTTAATASISSMRFGASSGMQSGCIHRIAEISIWPIKGSSSAVQSQAHVYGA